MDLFLLEISIGPCSDTAILYQPSIILASQTGTLLNLALNRIQKNKLTLGCHWQKLYISVNVPNKVEAMITKLN